MHPRVLPALLGALAIPSSLSAQTNASWEVVGTPAISAGEVVCCQMVFDADNVPYVVYQDQTVYGGHAIVQRFVNGSWESVGAPGQASIAESWYNTLGFDGSGNLFLCSRDYGVGGRLLVRKFPAGGSSWQTVGAAGASPDQAHYTWLGIAAGGIPCAAFQDRGTTPADRPSVMRFDPAAGQWSYLGAQGITSQPTGYNSLAVDSHGTIYTAFSDGENLDSFGNGRATVLRWDEASASWSPVGQPGFTPIGAQNGFLAVDHHDHLYFAYLRYHQCILVLRFDGTNWVQVGAGPATDTDRPAVETEGWRQWISLRFDSQDTPYVAYELWDYQNMACVRRFDGQNWVLVGQHGFSAGAADYLSLAIDHEDVPYVVFRDNANGLRTTVMRYAPSPYYYGRATTSSTGCVAEISASGDASPSSGLPFRIEALQVPNERSGMLLWSSAPDAIPFGVGALALHAPIHRTPLQSSGGNSGSVDCSGSYSFDFNAGVLAPGSSGLRIGACGFAQYWFRDPALPGSVCLTGGVRFRILP